MSHHPSKALLLTAPGCAHCAALKKILDKLLADGLIEQLDIIDVASHPEIANQYNVKSVPWLKLGQFEFQGTMREPDLRYWMTQLDAPEGITRYLKHLFATGELKQVIDMVRDKPEFMDNLLALVANEETDMKIQLGVSAVFEEFEGSPLLRDIVEQLGELAKHKNPKIRADVAHYLSLCHSDVAVPYLQMLAKDTDREVREIANEILSDLEY